MGQSKLVALTPDAAEAIEALGEEYLCPFISSEIETYSTLIDDSLERVRGLTDWFEKLLVKTAPEVSAVSFSPLRFCFLSMLSLFVQFRLEVHALRRLFSERRPEKIFYFKPSCSSRFPLTYQMGESSWAAILEYLKESVVRSDWAQGVSLQEVETSRATGDFLVKRTGFAWAWKGRARDWAVRQREKWRLFNPFSRWCTKFSAGEKNPIDLAFLNSGYELNWLRRVAAKRHDVRIRNLTEGKRREKGHPPFEPWMEGLEETFFSDSMAGSLCSWEQIDWRAAMSEKWRGFFHLFLPKAWDDFCRWRKTLAASPPAMVFHEEIGHGTFARTVVDAAMSLGIPTGFYQWGGGWGYYKHLHVKENELRSDIAFSYTSTVSTEFLNDKKKVLSNSEDFSIGSPYFAALKEKTAGGSSRPIDRITYLPTIIKGGYYYGLDLEDNLYFVLMKKILSSLDRWGKRPITLKLPPASNFQMLSPIKDWIRRTHLDVTISHVSLRRLFPTSNLWVIDYPSTVLQEILTAKECAIYVNTRACPLRPEAEEAVSRATLMVDGWAEGFDGKFYQQLDRALNGWRPDSRLFLNKYVNMEETGSAKQVAEKGLEKIIRVAQRMNNQ